MSGALVAIKNSHDDHTAESNKSSGRLERGGENEKQNTREEAREDEVVEVEDYVPRPSE